MESKSLNNMEIRVLAEYVNNANTYGEDGGLCFDEIKVDTLSVEQLKGYVSQLVQKGYLITSDSYFTHYLKGYKTIINKDGKEIFTFNVLEDKVSKNNQLKNMKHMEDNFNTPVMDTKIEVLNEYSKVKMSSISKNKRPAAKFCKEAAKYILDNWDNIEGLKQCQDSIRKDAEEFDDIKSSKVVTLCIHRITELSEEIRKEEKKTPKQDKKTSVKKEVKSEDKEKQPKTKGAKNERKVGDIHPKHDTWVWTEYTPGKFDWRINPQDKQKVGSKAKSDEAKPTKKVKKEAKPKEVKHVTIEEFLEQSKGAFKSQLSKTQKESLKLIQKGWRIVDINGTYFFKSSDGQNKSCNMDSVNALIKRMKIDYIPTGLIVK